MNCNIIHETVIRDILDVMNDVKKNQYIEGLYGRGKSFRSIAQASSNLTLVFPVLTSRNINIENASMVTKAIERKAVTMLQMLFSAINISEVDNGIEYIKQFHTNLKIDDKITVDQFIDAMDKFVIQNESHILSNKSLYESVKQDLLNINKTLPDSISESSLNSFKYYPSTGDIINEADDDNLSVNVNISNLKMPQTVLKQSSSKRSNKKDENEVLGNQLIDTDVKKANELVPTMMIVNYVSVEDSESPIESRMVIGVKAKLYPIDSVDILNRIVVKNEDNNGFLKLIKATTREISFARDLVFAIDKAKLDALSHSRRGSSSKLWKILERRSLKSKFRRTLGQINDASAISTLVISQEEVEYLKKSEGINIQNPRVIRPIMEAYNLMGVCILNESMETASFIFDTGSDIYEEISFNHLERETNDGSYKKVINLMNKISR